MSQEILEKHESLVLDIASVFLDNMELELGKKYKNNAHEVNAGLSNDQHSALRDKHDMPNAEFADLYLQFQNMKPTQHLLQAMGAFTASGGSVEIEPHFDEATQRLSVPIKFVIKDKVLDSIEGLSKIEAVILQMDAMTQVDTVLSGSDPDVAPSF